MIVECEVLGRRVDYLGQPAIIGTLLDITERTRMQEELVKAERLQAELEKEKEVNGLKRRFVSMISHEFRNPLAVILSSTHQLQRYFDRMSPEQQRTRLEQIQQSVTRLTDLLDETLMISRAETVGLEYHPAMIDIKELCQSLIQGTWLTCEATHSIHFTSTTGCGLLLADTKLLGQAISNLLSNAVKYSPEGSRIQVHLAQEDGETRISVQDEGIGIPQDDQKHLFETFHRAANVGHTPGTGLGLAIVKQAVETHGGSVHCESEVGRGTTFTLILPTPDLAAVSATSGR
jgi:signal transduction histidine kinase